MSPVGRRCKHRHQALLPTRPDDLTAEERVATDAGIPVVDPEHTHPITRTRIHFGTEPMTPRNPKHPIHVAAGGVGPNSSVEPAIHV